MTTDTEAHRWRETLRSARGDAATRQGIGYLLARMDEGLVFRPGDVDLTVETAGYAEHGLVDSLERFWPQFGRLVAGNESIARRVAELTGRVLTVEVVLDGFAAGVRHFSDDSHLVQLDTGLFLTIFEVVQVFVEVATSTEDEREAIVVLELLLAEYRVFRRNASPKGRVPTPRQGEFVGELTHATNVFVLAHEIAHVLLGHGAGRDDARRADDEIVADVFGFTILAGTYADGPTISPELAHGRLLGARLVFCCIELVENATFVTRALTHPPAADRWVAVRETAEQLFGPAVPGNADMLWRPMERVISAAWGAQLPMPEVTSVLESMVAGGRMLGEIDVPSALRLIRLARLLRSPAGADTAVYEEGVSLAVMAREDGGVVSWQSLIAREALRRGAWTDECAAVVREAARILASGFPPS